MQEFKKLIFYLNQKIINLGIVAHADAGKTTLTDQFLYQSGTIKTLGDVDKGTSHTDFLEVEKQRGISIRSAVTTIFYNNTKINIIDTPGHIDFSADVERNLRILDAVIIVVSAVEGVQAHTENIWDAISKLKIPCIIFINKTDRLGADPELVFEEIKTELKSCFVAIQKLENIEDNEPQPLWNSNKPNDTIIEILAEFDDKILKSFIDEESISFEIADKVFKQLVQNFSIIPTLIGSAKKGLGIIPLLNAIVNYLIPDDNPHESELNALIYRIDYIQGKGKIAGLRLFGGNISNKDIIYNATKDINEKVHQVWQYNGAQLIDTGLVEAGDIAAVSGLNESSVGDLIGKVANDIPNISMFTPLLTLQVRSVNDSDYAKLGEALTILSDEDPSLELEWLNDLQEFHLKIMGWIQIEILKQTLDNRFGVEAVFEDPTVIYRETPKKTAEGYAKYWMPKPCWAIIKLKIEPGESGSGLQYESCLSTDKVQRKYQNEIERTFQKALKQGPKGWEVTDLKIQLIDGEDHEIHSRPGDFVIATPMAIMNGLINSDTDFLEPYIGFKIKAPLDLLGAITGDIIKMRGSFNSPAINNDKVIITGELPLATSLDFPVKLRSRSGGKAKIKTWFETYRKCSEEHAKAREYKGVNPLDEAKYILKARKALQDSNK